MYNLFIITKRDVITCNFRLFMYEKFLIRQHVAEQNGLDSSRWPLSLFPHSPGFVQLRQDQVVSSSLSFLLFGKMWPTSRWLLQLGMFPWRPILKRQRKSRWVSIIDSPHFTKLSYVNTRCSNVHCCMTATEMAWPDEFNCTLPKPLTPLPAP